jgi:homoserine dehydrogenase
MRVAAARRYDQRVPKLSIGLIGCGTVGGAFVELLTERREIIATRTGVELTIGQIAVRSPEKYRDRGIAAELFTDDPQSVVENPEIDVVVELIGGLDPARALIRRALELGKPVVTGNKELLAAHGTELYGAAAASGVDLLFEAAVAGGIPLVRVLRESLVGEDVNRVTGIINGTTNFILTKMAEEGADYADALAEAQRLGYAEADPTADVEGFDAGAKAAIIASIVFGAGVVPDDVHHEGISGVTAADIESARRLGYVIKALAVIDREDGPDGPAIGVRVHPAMVPHHHPLATVNDSFNAVFVEGTAVGELMFYGRGAGGDPTASAVLGDVIDAAVNLMNGDAARLVISDRATVRSVDAMRSQFYLTMKVSDRPGVLAQVAAIFGQHGVSIQTMEQWGAGDEAEIYFILHETTTAAIRETLAELSKVDAVQGIGSVIRLVDGR